MNNTIADWIQMSIQYKKLKNKMESARDEIVAYMKRHNASHLTFVTSGNQKKRIALQKIQTVYVDPSKLNIDEYERSATTRGHERLTLLTDE